MYRPEGWKNPLASPEHCQDMRADIAFEAGADAMLEGLKKEGERMLGCDVDGGFNPEYLSTCNINPRNWGYLVFIPEEEQ